MTENARQDRTSEAAGRGDNRCGGFNNKCGGFSNRCGGFAYGKSAGVAIAHQAWAAARAKLA